MALQDLKESHRRATASKFFQETHQKNQEMLSQHAMSKVKAHAYVDQAGKKIYAKEIKT